MDSVTATVVAKTPDTATSVAGHSDGHSNGHIDSHRPNCGVCRATAEDMAAATATASA